MCRDCIFKPGPSHKPARPVVPPPHTIGSRGSTYLRKAIVRRKQISRSGTVKKLLVLETAPSSRAACTIFSKKPCICCTANAIRDLYVSGFDNKRSDRRETGSPSYVMYSDTRATSPSSSLDAPLEAGKSYLRPAFEKNNDLAEAATHVAYMVNSNFIALGSTQTRFPSVVDWRRLQNFEHGRCPANPGAALGGFGL